MHLKKSVAFLFNKNDWRLQIVGRITLSDMSLYLFTGPMNQGVPGFYYHPKYK